jgi:hypothetical protein
LLVATPCLLSWSFDYLLPWPWLGCLSLLYATYLTTQTVLIVVALFLGYLNIPFRNVRRPGRLLSKGTPRSTLLRSCLLTFTALAVLAALAAALLTVVGSVYQFSGLFESCFCNTPVSSWLDPPSQRPVFTGDVEYTSQSYQDNFDFLEKFLYWAAAIFTCVICFLGWWYQRSLRGSLRQVIEGI